MAKLIINNHEFTYTGYFYGRIENNILYLHDNVKAYEYKISKKGFSNDDDINFSRYSTPKIWLDTPEADEYGRAEDYIQIFLQYEGDDFGIVHYTSRVCDINFPIEKDRDKFINFIKNEIIQQK